MKRFVSLAVVLGMWLCASAALRQTSAAEKKAGGGKSASLLYQQHCAKCHGADGKGIESLQPPDLTQIKASEKQVLEAINNGRGMMPAYKGRLSSEEISALVRHVRSFSRSSAAKSKRKA